jgi:hypothetical protein
VPRLSEINLECFTAFDHAKPFKSEFERIEPMLKNEAFVKDKLGELDKAMWRELESRYTPLFQFITQGPVRDRANGFQSFYDRNTDFGSIDPSRKKKSIFKGILTAVLRETEIANGFGEVSYAWGIGADPFLSNLRARRPFKDYSANETGHGEYTHRIQWWIVCNYILPRSHRNAELYAQCANISCEFETDVGRKRVYIWDYLFDNAQNTTGVTQIIAKGTSPLNVFAWCKDESYPLLSTFLKYRVAKATSFTVDIMMENEPLGSTLAVQDIPAGILERAARRFRGISYADLSAEDRAFVEAIKERGFTNRRV